MKPHWPNPWDDGAVYDPIEELALCYDGLGKGCIDIDGSRFVWTVDRVLEHWKQGLKATSICHRLVIVNG